MSGVLFLDVDGVLNSAEFFVNGKPRPKSAVAVDPSAVRRVHRIVRATGAKVVLTSTWRKGDLTLGVLREAGLPIDDQTPELRGPNGGTYVRRCDEIEEWLRAHPDVLTFVILDDDVEAGMLHPDRFVRTYWRLGMYGKHERKVIDMLGPATTPERSDTREEER